MKKSYNKKYIDPIDNINDISGICNFKDTLLKFKKSIKNRDSKGKLSALNNILLISITNPQVLEDIMPDILSLFNDDDWRVRKSVLEIIGNVGFIKYSMVKKYIGYVLKKLNDPNPNVVCSAAYAIIKITINPECKKKSELMNNTLKKIINNDYRYIEIIKNISEIYPEIVQKYIKNILKYLNEDSVVLKINVLKILGNVENIVISKNTANKIVENLKGPPELKKYSAYAIWKLCKKNNKEYFIDTIDLLVENINLEEDNQLLSYSLMALCELCYLNPKKCIDLELKEKLLNNKNIRKPLLTLLYNLSTIDHKVLTPHLSKLHNLLKEDNDIWTNKMIIRIIGTIGLYDKKYIDKYLDTFKEKFKIPELKQDIVLALIKGNYIDREVLTVILRAIRNIDDHNNIDFLKEVIAYYPYELLDSLCNEIKRLMPYINKDKKINNLLNIIDERKKEKTQVILNNVYDNTVGVENDPEEPSVIVALKSECTQVELEDGNKVYILPENSCIKTTLSNELLKILEKYSKTEVEMYKLSHEIMIKSLIENILNNVNYNNDSKNNSIE